MSNALPKSVDVWRMVSARRIFEGRLGLEAMPRLVASLADATGACEYKVEFDRNEMDLAFIGLKLRTTLPLTCQRTLERFEFPVSVDQRLGLVRSESEEAMLPEDYEPVLVPSDGLLSIADIIEDELILAMPVVPMSDAGLSQGELVWEDADVTLEDSEEAPSDNPFAVLADLKKTH